MGRGEIRKDVLKFRMAMDSPSVEEKSAIITERIMASGPYLNAGSLMVYVDFRNEVRTGMLIARALAEGKRVSVPITDVKGKKLTPSRLLFYPEDLEPGAWGILEPRPSCIRPVDPAELDLIIVPGVAYDQWGNRLGYGGGFYDRFLPGTRKGTVYLAPAFEAQLVENVFPGAHDIPVHIIFTEERIIGGTGGKTL